MLIGLICALVLTLFAIMACIPLLTGNPVIAQDDPTVIAQEEPSDHHP